MDNYSRNPNHYNSYDPSGQDYYNNPGGYGVAEGPPPLMGCQQEMPMAPPDQYYDGGGGGYVQDPYGMGMDPNGYYGQQQQQQQPSQQQFDQGGYGDYAQFNAEVAAMSTKKGTYYFQNDFVPQIFGFPVSALCHDTSYDALFIASTTQIMSSTRWRSQRCSMLVTHNNTLDGMLYSSVAGHPEADHATLQTVYETLYGIEKTVSLPPGRLSIPPHAYKPPYGSSEVETSLNTMMGQKHGHMGITSILPLEGGYAATISPAAVRIHANGGLQVCDHDVQGMLSGTIHPHSDGGAPTHISVGGIPISETKSKEYEIHCLDLWQGLRKVSSRGFKDRYEKKVGVTAMATSHERGSIVAGCTDGYIRILDGSLRELATVKSHAGGVSSMAVSPDGMLVATTGYSSRVVKGKKTSILYAFPDPTLYVYDLRYLGRGGISHPFAGVRGSPRHVAFVPDMEGLPSNRLVAASGQAGGGLQILTPYTPQNEKSTSFFLPQLDQGEFMTAMSQSEDDLALGTSSGRVIRYKLKGFESSTTKSKPKMPLVMPSFVPPPPAVSLDPNLLQTGNDPGMRNGNDERLKAIISCYILQADPKLSSIGNSAEEAMGNFGVMGGTRIIPQARRTVAASFLNEATPMEGEYSLTVPVSKLDIDLLANHNPVSKKRYKGKTQEPKPNPNKLLYNSKLSSMCYEDGFNGRRRQKGSKGTGSSADLSESIPKRYRLQLRPTYKTSGAFEAAEHNDTGLFPGWDYTPTMPNAFATPVMLLLYFIPEIRSSILSAQNCDKLFSARGYEKALSPELGFIYHQIESLSRFAFLHPFKPNADPLKPRVGAWVPSNFLTTLSTMPEAEQMQILDGSPAAVDPPRRPEAFYRFLAYQLDKELSKTSDNKLMDSLHGLNWISINQFIAGSSPPSQSSTRAMTVDFNYDVFGKGEKRRTLRFGEVLQHTLCRETRLRAWNSSSKAFETIVQRKIATSLPQVLMLSGACAGRKEEDGLCFWRTDDGGEPWLPETVEICLEDDGNVTVKELIKIDEDGTEAWSTFKGKASLPKAVSQIISEASSRQTYRYNLQAVLSYVSDDPEGVGDDEHPGHHVLHARIPLEYKKRVLKQQGAEAAKRASQESDPSSMVLSAAVTAEIFKKRAEKAANSLATAEETESDWVLYNGFVVSKTVVEDARAFHVSFKEPCLIIFRAVDEMEEAVEKDDETEISIPGSVMNTKSLSPKTEIVHSFDSETIKPGKLIAFDAEFVSVQEEESTITDSGSKMVVRDTRHAVGRISVIDCEARKILIDDHVLPRERVVDYLTRFSGIVAEDLDPQKTTHNLISTRNAYLKLRYLMEQGCIFVGHGLRQDFATVNLVVPPHQILDTVEIFHQPGMRYISLRFLSNYFLKRDMQQDTHDSVEDALAAFELYEKALEWKEQGIFNKKLQEIYTHGQKTDWKIGVE